MNRMVMALWLALVAPIAPASIVTQDVRELCPVAASKQMFRHAPMVCLSHALHEKMQILERALKRLAPLSGRH